MAQNPKTLELVGARLEGAATRVLTLAEIGGTGFHDIGGKYVIVHTGVVAGDKPIKRAYSLMPGAAGPGRAELAVKRIGVGASALHGAPLGATFTFSGPWGKLVPEGGLVPTTLLVATDTGITSALGIVEQSAHAGAARAGATRAGARTLAVLWFTDAQETFLDADAVRARIEGSGARLHTAHLPSAGSDGRLAAALPHVKARAIEHGATHVIATGDGAVVHPLKTLLLELLPQVVDVRCECFFNNPEKKSG